MTKSKTQPKNCLRVEVSTKAWRKAKLRSLGKVITGTTPPTAQKADYFGGSFPFITPTDIADFNVRYNYITERFLSDKWGDEAKKILIPKGSTCFVCIGSTIGKICLTKDNSFTNQQINTIVVDSQKADFKYVYYLLKNNQGNIIKQYGGGGSGKAIINKSTFESIEFVIPENPNEQKRIADILSGFDDKIELNNKINQNLEQTAQAIFKEWFVNSKNSKNWKTKKITEIIKRLPVGKKYDNKTAFSKGKIPVLDQGQSGFIGYHNDQPGVKASVESPVVIFTNHTCNYRLMTRDFSCIQNVLPYVGDKDYSTLFVYFLTKGKIKMQEYKGHWPEFEEQVFLIPPPPLAQKFTDYIKPVIEKMVGIENENQKLASLRDLLLPKLMSGEIRV